MPVDRRLEWLEGKIVAKDAVRLLLKTQLGLMHPADIEIYNDRHGRQSARGSWMNSQVNPPHVTITRSGGEALATAVDGSASTGLMALHMEQVG